MVSFVTTNWEGRREKVDEFMTQKSRVISAVGQQESRLIRLIASGKRLYRPAAYLLISWSLLVIGTTTVRLLALLPYWSYFSVSPPPLFIEFYVLGPIMPLLLLTLMIQFLTGYLPAFSLEPEWIGRHPWRIILQGTIFSFIISEWMFLHGWPIIVPLCSYFTIYVFSDLLTLRFVQPFTGLEAKKKPWYSSEPGLLSPSSIAHVLVLLIALISVAMVSAYLLIGINPLLYYNSRFLYPLLISVILGWVGSLVIIRRSGPTTDLLRPMLAFTLILSIVLVLSTSYQYSSIGRMSMVVVPTYILTSTWTRGLYERFKKVDRRIPKAYLKTTVRVVFIVGLGILTPGSLSSLPKTLWALIGIREPQEFSFYYQPEPPPLLQIAGGSYILLWLLLVILVELANFRRSTGSWIYYPSSVAQQSIIAKNHRGHEAWQTALYASFATIVFALPLTIDEDLMGAPFLVLITLVFLIQLTLRATRLDDKGVTPLRRELPLEKRSTRSRIQLFASSILVPVVFLFVYFFHLAILSFYHYGPGGFVGLVLFMWMFTSPVTLFTIGISVMGFAMLSEDTGVNPVITKVIADVCAFLAAGDLFRPPALVYSLPLPVSYLPEVLIISLLFHIAIHHQSIPKIQLTINNIESPEWRLSPSVKYHFIATLLIPLLIGASWYTGGAIYDINNRPGDVRIAVIDDGIDKHYPLLASHVIVDNSFVTVENGYQANVSETTSSDGHGTMVATTVLSVFPRASIINAKVFGPHEWDYDITTTGIVRAIRWCVEEQHADIINLSLGARYYSEIDAIVQWATEQGTLVVCAAGNEQTGLESTVNMPAASFCALAVAGLDPEGELYEFSSWGPINGTMKPEIAAPGFFPDSSLIRGTSFASPRVAGAAGKLIEICHQQNWTWNPGFLQALLMKGANRWSSDEYKFGCGVLDISRSINLMHQAPLVNGTPFVMYAFPTYLPLEIDRVFTGTPYKFDLKVVVSHPVQCTACILGEGNESVILPSNLVINGITRLPIEILVPDSSNQTIYDIDVVLETPHDVSAELRLRFDVLHPRARVAIDIYHARNLFKDIYSDYLAYYKWLNSELISTTELRGPNDFDMDYLRQFDAIIIPSTNPDSTEFTDEQRESLKTYFLSGGGFYIEPYYTGMNMTSLNMAFNWTGSTFDTNDTRVYANVSSTHPVAYGLDPNVYGRVLHSNGSYTSLLYSGDTSRTILSCWNSSGRIVVSGIPEIFENKRMLWSRITWWLCRL